ncbi:UvrD-helicase domain-containing protein [Vibrio splendidus]|uniref:UvrD-helicase domain-containing protein n=1 Tax=Vibrio splendidus TaxID=29497 RepID=UPI0021189EF5|nr:ATP-dependent helicase [Vibrio splendidus]MCQ8865984.1 ATP-dependent helicase [Vibrio splendidus]
MRFCTPESWIPKGIDELESSAWSALKDQNSVCVIAGPGAGKTEFLAQKAVYLLETGICPPNQKILAISFKADAAKNLEDRVKARCPRELSDRFVSMTFDAFTKNILDRFRLALPIGFRPSKNYDIYFPGKWDYSNFVSETYKKYISLDTGVAAASGYLNQNIFQFESSFIGKFELGCGINPDAYNYFYNDWINNQINHKDNSQLSFMVINRLADFIIRNNKNVVRAIKATYPIVFVDEFQDTTYGQYNFLRSAFDSKITSITSVGDFKQRIMGWAGAKTDVFKQFKYDFNATQYELICNHRSSPELVKIQHHISHVIDHQAREVNSQALNKIDGNSCWICNTTTQEQEIRYLANFISSDRKNRGLDPKDYAILVKQKASNYNDEFYDIFSEYGLKLCNADEKRGVLSIQDLLSEELIILFSNVMHLGCSQRLPEVWAVTSEQLELIWNIDENDHKKRKKMEAKFDALLKFLRVEMTREFNEESVNNVFSVIFDFFEFDKISQNTSYLGDKERILKVCESLKEHYSHSFEHTDSWSELIEEFDKKNHVHIMTIHKSKGLEFDTVVFAGFDDSAWWSFSKGREEGLCVFFVALSRAKQRAIFSHCSGRGQTNSISELFQLLKNAGVQEVTGNLTTP